MGDAKAGAPAWACPDQQEGRAVGEPLGHSSHQGRGPNCSVLPQQRGGNALTPGTAPPAGEISPVTQRSTHSTLWVPKGLRSDHREPGSWRGKPGRTEEGGDGGGEGSRQKAGVWGSRREEVTDGVRRIYTVAVLECVLEFVLSL